MLCFRYQTPILVLVGWYMIETEDTNAFFRTENTINYMFLPSPNT